MTQPQLAQKLGVSNGIISQWENDINEPKACYLMKLAEILNISADELLGLETKQPILYVDSEGYSDEEKSLINMYRELDETHRRYIYDNVRLYNESDKNKLKDMKRKA